MCGKEKYINLCNKAFLFSAHFLSDKYWFFFSSAAHSPLYLKPFNHSVSFRFKKSAGKPRRNLPERDEKKRPLKTANKFEVFCSRSFSIQHKFVFLPFRHILRISRKGSFSLDNDEKKQSKISPDSVACADQISSCPFSNSIQSKLLS